MRLVDWLLILFVYLKLCHVIDWSWWFVTAPLWGSLLMIVGMNEIEKWWKR